MKLDKYLMIKHAQEISQSIEIPTDSDQPYFDYGQYAYEKLPLNNTHEVDGTSRQTIITSLNPRSFDGRRPDLFSRRIRALSFLPTKDKGKNFIYSDKVTTPYQDFKNGKPIGDMRGNVVNILRRKGYTDKDIGNLADNTDVLYGTLDSSGKSTTENPNATIYVDDKGNILARTKAVHIGQRAGRLAGAGIGGIGGGYLGYKGTDWLNKKLGLTADRGGWRKWLGRGIKGTGTIGLGVLGGAGGYILGENVGHSIGNTLQKGTKLNVTGGKLE